MFDQIRDLAKCYNVKIPDPIAGTKSLNLNQRLQVAQDVIQAIANKDPRTEKKMISVVVDQANTKNNKLSWIFFTASANPSRSEIRLPPLYFLEESELQELKKEDQRDPQKIADLVRDKLGYQPENQPLWGVEKRAIEVFVKWHDNLSALDRKARVAFTLAHELGHIGLNHSRILVSITEALADKLKVLANKGGVLLDKARVLSDEAMVLSDKSPLQSRRKAALAIGALALAIGAFALTIGIVPLVIGTAVLTIVTWPLITVCDFLPPWLPIPLTVGTAALFATLGFAFPALIPTLIGVFGLCCLGMLVFYIAKKIDQNWQHRHEFQADSFAVKTVGVQGGITFCNFYINHYPKDNKDTSSHPSFSKRKLNILKTFSIEKALQAD